MMRSKGLWLPAGVVVCVLIMGFSPALQATMPTGMLEEIEGFKLTVASNLDQSENVLNPYDVVITSVSAAGKCTIVLSPIFDGSHVIGDGKVSCGHESQAVLDRSYLTSPNSYRISGFPIPESVNANQESLTFVEISGAIAALRAQHKKDPATTHGYALYLDNLKIPDELPPNLHPEWVTPDTSDLKISYQGRGGLAPYLKRKKGIQHYILISYGPRSIGSKKYKPVCKIVLGTQEKKFPDPFVTHRIFPICAENKIPNLKQIANSEVTDPTDIKRILQGLYELRTQEEQSRIGGIISLLANLKYKEPTPQLRELANTAKTPSDSKGLSRKELSDIKKELTPQFIDSLF